MGKGAIIGALFILSILSVSGYTTAQELGQGASDVKAAGWIITFSENGKNFPMYMSCSNGICKSIGALKLPVPDSIKGNSKECNLLMKFSVEFQGQDAIITGCSEHAESSCPVTINACRKYKWKFFDYKNKEFGILKYHGKIGYKADSPNSITGGNMKVILSDSSNKKVIANPLISWSAERTGVAPQAA